MTHKGIYIYGIVKNDCVTAIKSALSESGVYTIEYEDIAAVVSDTKLEKIEYMNREELARLLIDHQQKIEKLMSLGCSNIIPMQLGTIVSSGNDVMKILENGKKIFSDTFNKINGVEEIDIAAVWSNFGEFIKKVSENPQIIKMKAAIADKGSCNEADSSSIGKLIKEKIDQKNSKVNLDVHNSLMPFCIASKKHETMNDEMPVNYAFLVKKENHYLFINKIDELDSIYVNKLNFKIVGPLPCYSFYTAECKAIRKADIDKAKSVLGIDLSSQEYDLKKAYRLKASLTHPDKQSNNVDDEGSSFTAANNAYKVLLDYGSIIKQASSIELKDPFYLVKIKN